MIAAAIEAVLVVVVCEELLESTETDEVPNPGKNENQGEVRL